MAGLLNRVRPTSCIFQPAHGPRQHRTVGHQRERPRPHASSSSGGAGYGSGEKHVHEQMEPLRQAAKGYMEAVLQQMQESIAQQKAATSTVGSVDNERLKEKIKYAISTMQEGLIERETEVRLLLLAALCKEHVLYIGPPGTAKSEIGRRLTRLVEGTYFERLLTRFSVPEELFGPLSMRALEEDKYLRQTRGYLPDAQVAFVDEIFKANSAILNTLLTLLNERLFDNGSTRVAVPLITLVGASNELPESEELDALFDRFLLRREVRQVSPSGLMAMLTYYAATPDGGRMGEVDASQLLRPEDFAAVRQEAVRKVAVPEEVIQLLADLRGFLQDSLEPPVYVSDRRLVKSVALMQVAAYCNGRERVSQYDCLLLEHILWNKPEQAERISDWLLSQLAVDDGIKQVQYLLTGVFARACKSLGNEERLVEIQGEVGQLRQVLSEKLAQVTLNLEGGFPVVLDNLWLSSEEAASVAAALVPKLRRTREAVEATLYDVATLEVALEARTDAVMLANLLPKHWADFIRNSPMDDVRPIGTTPIRSMLML